MKTTTDYVMNKGTSVIFPEYNEDGKLQSVVVENNRLYRVDQKPTTLVDQNLRYYGSSLRGAKDGTRMILGNVMMSPVVINERLNLYWFPSKSPYRDDCVWFALQHIKDYKAIGNKKTSITLLNGTKFMLDLSSYSFEERFNNACRLKTLIEGRTIQLMVCESEQAASYLISKDRCDRNYEVLERE
ncbi:competence protein ComK [Sporosarcina obsidiansis]|uniref:competence protein ComK n=1 Tax=Sporosarcina obsidiansis TaxID=2660748 RepID=UPI00129BEB5D|nr:competence protein ComK [Sporosarcina obsidiansis]